MCLVDGECELCHGTMRNTGDIAFRCDATGHVYVIGRTDRQIKRKGHRVNMDRIQQVGESLVFSYLLGNLQFCFCTGIQSMYAEHYITIWAYCSRE